MTYIVIKNDNKFGILHFAIKIKVFAFLCCKKGSKIVYNCIFFMAAGSSRCKRP